MMCRISAHVPPRATLGLVVVRTVWRQGMWGDAFAELLHCSLGELACVQHMVVKNRMNYALGGVHPTQLCGTGATRVVPSTAA